MNQEPRYQPKQIPLFDLLVKEFNLHSDAAIGRFTDTDQSSIARIRYGKERIGDGLTCRVSRATGWSVAEIDALAKLSN